MVAEGSVALTSCCKSKHSKLPACLSLTWTVIDLLASQVDSRPHAQLHSFDRCRW
jgi:hypothetical protein